jgi:hypothetical protein
MYQGDGDELMQKEHRDLGDRIVLVPDALPSKVPDATPRLRIMWGQHLLEDLLVGRYRSLVCAVNGQDNSHGIIAQLADLLPTSQWDQRSITAHAAQFSLPGDDRVKVLKYDMDMVEVLAILRPTGAAGLTLDHLSTALKVIGQMIQRRPGRLPTASVSFLGAHANMLVDAKTGREPTFEAVLKVMYDAGYGGDVYPNPDLWHLGQVGVFARYPFPQALDRMRQGGY